MKLQPGDKIQLSLEDGAITAGWAVWEISPGLGPGFRGPCHFFYDMGDLYELSEFGSDPDNDADYCCMAQQLIAEGLI